MQQLSVACIAKHHKIRYHSSFSKWCMVVLSNIRIVLVNPSHPGNIGAVARAMKNMGLLNLVLVNPKRFPHHEATERASGAADVLANATVVESTQAAIADCNFVLATSSRERSLTWPQVTARQAAIECKQRVAQGNIAILFGAERTGLLNEELQLADKHLIIPANPDYPSLNLAQAVQLITYELFQAFQEECITTLTGPQKANSQEFEGMIEHFQDVLTALDIWSPDHPKKLMPKVRRLLTKAECDKEEINILRGLLKVFHTLAMRQHSHEVE